MNYIGSKHRLSGFIFNTITEFCGTDLSKQVFCDLFAGTGIVGRTFKTHVKHVISNDVEYYSYVLNRNYIGNHHEIEYQNLVCELDSLSEKKGFIYENYSHSGKGERNYFASENGQKIDAVRTQIEIWKNGNYINENQL